MSIVILFSASAFKSILLLWKILSPLSESISRDKFARFARRILTFSIRCALERIPEIFPMDDLATCAPC